MSVRYSGTGIVQSSNPFSPQHTANGKSHQDLIHEAVVVDVIVNDTHPNYATDGYNVGAIKFRALKYDAYKGTDQLHWALPIESNITDYPLLNEIITIHAVLNRLYYSRKINISSRVTTQAVFGINEELSEVIGADKHITNIKASTRTPRVNTSKPEQLGKYFKDNGAVNRLRSDEGDIIYEGRTGQSIRFGAAWKVGTTFPASEVDQSPNILFKVGPDKTQIPSVSGKFGLVKEDINKDASSIWMVSDQIVPLQYSTVSSQVHGKSIINFPTRLAGNQIVINTDRFVVNTKKDKFMAFSGKGMHLTTLEDFTVDSDRDYLSRIGRLSETFAGNRISLVAPKIYIGLREGTNEPIPIGATLAKFIQNFLDVFINNASRHILPTGTPGSPSILNPAIVLELKKLQRDAQKGALASFNSKIAYTTK